MAFKKDELDTIAYLPNGEINAPYVLSNAQVLLNAGEIAAAGSLFRRIKDHPKYGHCGYFGIGQCLIRLGHPKKAVIAFEKALLLERRPYIASALVDALARSEDWLRAESRALQFAKEFAADSDSVAVFKSQYQRCIARERFL